VKPHPTDIGRYILNFGARRLRASRMAGKPTIPAFVDATADDFDQVAENEQRQGLTPMELALFVKRKADAGMAATEIARRLAKSKGMVSYALALANAPDWVMLQYRSGKCRGLRELYELGKLHQRQPQAVEQHVAQQPTVTRSTVESIKEALAAHGGEFDCQTQSAPAAAAPSVEQFDGQTSKTPPAVAEVVGRSTPSAKAAESTPVSAPQRWALDGKTGAMRESQKGEWVRWADVEAAFAGEAKR
jgi:ParB family chromosome partitioning protein